jgi:hypothetical protein
MRNRTTAGLGAMVATMFALGMAGSAFAQAPEFDDLDANGDGYISRDEASSLPCLAEVFDQLDTESPNGLNRAEYMRAVAAYCAE